MARSQRRLAGDQHLRRIRALLLSRLPRPISLSEAAEDQHQLPIPQTRRRTRKRFEWALHELGNESRVPILLRRPESTKYCKSAQVWCKLAWPVDVAPIGRCFDALIDEDLDSSDRVAGGRLSAGSGLASRHRGGCRHYGPTSSLPKDAQQPAKPSREAKRNSPPATCAVWRSRCREGD